MTDAIQLERLYAYLGRVMSDGEIIARPRLRMSGQEKVAKHMGVSVDQVPALIDSLAAHLQQQVSEADEAEADVLPRYTWDKDALGSVVVRDNDTGEEIFLNVQQASRLMSALDDDHGTEQEALAQAMNEGDVSCELSADEFGLSASSLFNFPWKLNESSGFATCEYSGFGKNFSMKLVHVVDQDGEPVQINEKAVLEQGKNFIKDA